MTGGRLWAARAVLCAGLRWLCSMLANYGALHLGRPEITEAVVAQGRPRVPRPGSSQARGAAWADAPRPGRGAYRLDGPPGGPERLLPDQPVSDLERFVLRELSRTSGFGAELDSDSSCPNNEGMNYSTRAGTTPVAETTASLPDQASIGQLFALAARLSGGTWMRLVNDRLGIGWTALNVLRELGARDGRTSKEIARAAGVAAPTLTGVVDTMARDGLIERRRSDTDRRVVRLHLTDAGRERLAVSDAELSEEFDQLFNHVDPADAPAVRRFLRSVVDRLSAGSEPGGAPTEGPSC
ncbi:MarR family transcriptional regulator [Streptomyces sp. NBC_01190]|uniref:MarR family transcriptional regulator n=1 Tax=Streptomyces sp. NBC_01190 TaxID=2903767 RepID=UPI003869B5C6|nr:MarR family transcriptional regulator [Streptomyces sp. NBC_01190]